MIIIALVGYIIFNHESNKVLNYSIREQLKDIFPSVILALSMALIVFGLGIITSFKPTLTLTIQIFAGIAFVLGMSELFKLNEYIFLKTTILEKINVSRSS
jgi:hypothetical protein